MAWDRRKPSWIKNAQDRALLNGWDTDMRYASSSDVLQQPYKRWAEQAKQLIDDMGAL